MELEQLISLLKKAHITEFSQDGLVIKISPSGFVDQTPNTMDNMRELTPEEREMAFKKAQDKDLYWSS